MQGYFHKWSPFIWKEVLAQQTPQETPPGERIPLSTSSCVNTCSHTRTQTHAHGHTRTNSHSCAHTRAHTHTRHARTQLLLIKLFWLTLRETLTPPLCFQTPPAATTPALLYRTRPHSIFLSCIRPWRNVMNCISHIIHLFCLLKDVILTEGIVMNPGSGHFRTRFYSAHVTWGTKEGGGTVTVERQ